MRPGLAPGPYGATISAVTGPYTIAIIVVALVLAAWALVLVVANRPPSGPIVVGAAVLELLLVGLLVGGIVQMLRSHHEFARAEFVGYLVACVVIPVLGVGWAVGERTRAGTAVLALAFLIMPVLMVRVQQVWAGPGA